MVQFTQRHQSWIYELSSWKAESMTKSFEDLIEDDDGKPEDVTASHILIAYQGSSSSTQTRTKEEARKKADQVLMNVQDGQDNFAELDKKHSDGPSAPPGGDLGEFNFERMAKPFSDAAFKLKVGKVSGVVETEFGFHIIKRTK